MEVGRDHDASRERLSGDSGMRSTKNLPTIHFSARVLDHMLRVEFRLRTIADQMIKIVWTNRAGCITPDFIVGLSDRSD
jgi:hypothetical protein